MNELNLLVSSSHEPALNLALEEYLLNKEEDYLLFYRNRDAVVMGKHQNPWREINVTYCKDHNIQILRRLSGGGTVYHDLDNINFSFLRSKDKDFVNFREHIEPLSKALEQLGIAHRITERNDLFIGEEKCSGNAEHLSNTNKRILHHGTLLFNSNLDRLREALNVKPYKIQTHAVASVSSKVTAIKQHTDIENSVDFLDRLIAQLVDILQIKTRDQINPSGIKEVLELSNEKYLRWNWTFGHVPEFSYENQEGRIKVRKGLITDLALNPPNTRLEKKALGLKYRHEELMQSLSNKEFEYLSTLCLPS